MSRPSSSSCAAVDCRAPPFRRAWLARLLVHTRPVEALERGCVCVCVCVCGGGGGGGGGVEFDLGEYIYLLNGPNINCAGFDVDCVGAEEVGTGSKCHMTMRYCWLIDGM